MSALETPSVVLDDQRLVCNIDWMQSLVTSHNVTLRPHVKTHKTREIAAMQLAAPSEALEFLRAEIRGIKTVTLAYPVVQADKIRQVLQVAQDMGVDFLLTIDSVQGLEAAEKAATATGCVVNMLLHINVGYHRIGIEHDEPLLFYLAQPMDKSERIEFCGLLSHAGQAYQCMSVAECAHVAEAELQVMVQIKDKLKTSGIPVAMVSVGSSFTEPVRRDFTGITELRPGNYVFLDRTPVRMGLFSMQQYNFILDAGSKVLSMDLARSAGAFGSTVYGLVFYENDFPRVVKEPTQHKTRLSDGHALLCFVDTRLSEEHGWVQQVDGVPSPFFGTRLLIVPNHSFCGRKPHQRI
ncbi:hypothetical protein PsorP6_000754 [Peronosclerospora sorghi]|uniref:Uncharacterized protein n=1 Tax=Peronosclerospora sorghi TaxID=230839 RepID=A0ACC0WS81_9STRA|nr:hypothetical protein PsorP6_000754 [Peronosclerospora sorghi]